MAAGREAPDLSTTAGQLASASWLAIYRLFRSDEAVATAYGTAASERLSPQQFSALLCLPLDARQGMRMRELARSCNSTASYTTSIVDTLEERGLVARRPDPTDRRVTQVHLTDEGLRTVGRCHERLAVPPSGFLALSEDELRTLRDLLERAAAPYPWPV